MNENDDKYSFALMLAGFAIMLGFNAAFLTGTLVAILYQVTPLASTLGTVGFFGSLGCIPLVLFLALIGEIADQRAAANDHRIALAWMRNHRTITSFLAVEW